ncbi:heavy metal translocating P-type ATPase [Vibrio mangrovi]|uniref:Copper-exporting P-type ATPase n=1 Tax=Vibrio mangrovi TaxID=474394 RepID=A0A1Y6IRU7_9VIBR|nr:copper-translocating P-type ATPase [Vibrio mangrovi]MDW6001590.1 copper-translocating P-type ATPase [Vibrio mangrovi]SMS00384.1 Copper-exporting P-type ATPase A [Vibrio mangrovi]
MNHLTLPLSGLHCMGCARKVERSLKEHFDVQIHNLSPSLIEVDTNASIDEIVENIESLGYQAGKRQTYHLQGLHCGKCVQKLSTLLSENEQITDLNVTKETLSLITTLSPQDIAEKVSSLGYQATLLSPDLPTEIHQTYRLQGLHCGKCVQKLTDLLNENEQIHDLEVTKESLSLTTTLPEQTIVDSVASLGYEAFREEDSSGKSNDRPTTGSEIPEITGSTKEPEPEHAEVTTHLLIKGMTCASCVSSVEKALLSVPGILTAQVNLAEQSAAAFSDQQPDTQQLVAAIRAAGYDAETVDDPALQQEKQQAHLQATLKYHQRNAFMGLLLGIPLMGWGVFGGSMLIQTPQEQLSWGIVGLLCLGLLSTAGRGFYQSAWQALVHKRATMDTLVALGTGVAWLYSIMVVIAPQWFPTQARHVYFEASAMIIGLISLGHSIESKAKAKTTQSLQALIHLQPQQATLITASGDQEISVAQIQKGMHLRIKPGDKLPVDGIVIEGESYLDESMLTGEPIPALKSSGHTVSAGTINQDGGLIIQATGVGSETMLSRIIQMVRRAQSSKPPIAKLADQISSVFVPVVVVIAIIAALIWFWVGPEPRISYMLVVATTVLIIACPCALGLATPLSVTVGVGKAAEMGILIRDAEVLQTASHIDTVVFDKTGTLTEGKPQVQYMESFRQDQNELLSIAYALEQQSEHPLAKAVCEYARSKQIAPAPISAFENLRGRGVTAIYQNHTVQIGSLSYLTSLGLSFEQVQAALDHVLSQAWTPILIAVDQEIQGIIAVADPIKADTAQTVQALNHLGIKTVMLTGDHITVARKIAEQLGIQDVIAQVLPDQKAEHVIKLQQAGHKVAMVGDGINDAPALAQADLGIAMASGSDVAIESAQMTFLSSSPLAILNAISLSKATVRNIRQNLLGAFIYNTLGIPVAAGVLYPWFGFLLSPVIAGAAMALSSITVVTNANRLRLFRPRYQNKQSTQGKSE